ACQRAARRSLPGISIPQTPWVAAQFPGRLSAGIRARNRVRTCRNREREGPQHPAFGISRLIAAQINCLYWKNQLSFIALSGLERPESVSRIGPWSDTPLIVNGLAKLGPNRGGGPQARGESLRKE